MAEDLKPRFVEFAKKMVTSSGRCKNEESAKLFLILPFINFLGYDDRDPNEVCPEHAADFSEKYKNRVDFVVMRAEQPIIAIECKGVGGVSKDDRGQLKSYFNAAPTIKLAILTDGISYEFFTDSDQPNMMDEKPFLVFDMKKAAEGAVEDNILDGVRSLMKEKFDPENIGAQARRKLVFQDFFQQINALIEAPNEDFTRILLQRAGIKHVRAGALPDYQAIAQAAFRDAINSRILRKLNISAEMPNTPMSAMALPPPDQPQEQEKEKSGIVTTESELAMFAYTKKRLAFLCKEEKYFEAIDRIAFKDYQGKMVVFYEKERKGKLFDFVESEKSPRFTFTFPGDIQVTADALGGAAFDKALSQLFMKRVNGEEA